MATNGRAYDDPAYRSPQFFSSTLLATTNVQGDKFVAFTNMICKSMTTLVTVMGTCGGTDIANGAIFVRHVQQGTATTTYAHTTWGTTGAGATVGTYTATTTTPATAISLTAGDVLYAQKGTDATLQGTVQFELYVSPGAALTV